MMYDAAAEAYREDIIEFEKALSFLSNIDLSFYGVEP